MNTIDYPMCDIRAWWEQGDTRQDQKSKTAAKLSVKGWWGWPAFTLRWPMQTKQKGYRIATSEWSVNALYFSLADVVIWLVAIIQFQSRGRVCLIREVLDQVSLWGDCRTDIHRKGGPAAGRISTAKRKTSIIISYTDWSVLYKEVLL